MERYSQLEITGKISENLIKRFFSAFDFCMVPYNLIIDSDALYDEGKVHVEMYFGPENEDT